MRAALALAVLAAAAAADVTRPAYLGLTEVAEGRFDVVWRVPRRGDRVLAIRAVLPDALRDVAPKTVELAPGVQTARWTVEGDPWELPGSTIRIEGPARARLDAMVRFAFADGTVVVRVLPPGEDTVRFPRRAAAADPARAVQAAALGGLFHVLLGFVHVVFVLGLALAGPPRAAAFALGLFLAGQLAGLALAPPVPEAVAHALLGVGAALAACRRGRAGAIALACGFAHGAVLDGGWAAALGQDAAGLAIALPAAFVLRGRALPAYAAGTAGVALALVAATVPDPPAAPERTALVAPAARPASAPVAAASDDPLQLFVEVTPFETRVEAVAAVAALGLANDATIPVAEQADVEQATRALLDRHVRVTIDGESAPATGIRSDFVTRDAAGVLERLEPVVEDAPSALVGVAYSYPTRAPPGRVSLRWDPPPGVESAPVVVVDPRTVRAERLDGERREVVWSDALAMPPVRAVAARGRSATVPLVSAALVALALVAAVRRGTIAARLLLAGACVAAPWAPVDVPLPGGAAPAEPEAVVEALLANVYRSLEQPDESAAYDRLGVSATDDALPPLYLEQRRLLELGRRGGARARVDAVEVTRAENVEPLDGGGFSADVAWEAAGFVVHYGHRHFRRNRYEAAVELVAEDGAWKIRRLDVRDKRRER